MLFFEIEKWQVELIAGASSHADLNLVGLVLFGARFPVAGTTKKDVKKRLYVHTATTSLEVSLY